MNLVKLYALSTGDLMIAEEIVIADDGSKRKFEQSYITVMRPLLMLISEEGVTLRTWCASDRELPVKVFNRHIMTEAVAPEGLAGEYRAKFEEKTITTPEPPQLIV